MKKWIQNTAGLILSIFLTLGLGAKVRAADEEETLPEPAPTEVSEPAPAAPKPAEASPVLPESPKPAEAPKPVETAPVDETPKAAEPEPTAGAPKSSEAAHADEAPAPVEESGPVETPAAGEDPAPVEAPFPAEGSSPAEAPAPVGENASDEEAAPVEEPFMVEAPTLVEEASPVEEAAQIEEPAPAEDPPPVEESLPAEETAASEEPLAATAVQSEENLVAAPVPALSAAPMRVSSPSPAADGNTGESGDPAGAPDGSASADITVGGKDAAEEDGWTYDESSGQVGLINFDRADIDIVSSGLNGLNIAAAGFNHLGTISSEGDIHITGTGILLVDDVMLGETGGLYLHTLTDLYDEGTGSVAFFLRQYDNLYLMLNGSVPGILDEDYTVRDADLYVPSGSKLLLYTGGAVTDPDTGGIVERYSGDQTVDPLEGDYVYNEVYSSLTLEDGSSLTVERGAEISMPSTPSRVTAGARLRSSLHVMDGARLDLDGSLNGDGTFKLDEAGVMTGSGSLTAHSITIDSASCIADCAVTMQSRDFTVWGSGSMKTLNIKDSDVVIRDYYAPVSIASLTNTGDSYIVNIGNISIGAITNSGDLSLRVSDKYDSDMNDSYYIGGPVSGGHLECHGGLFEFGPEFSLLNGA
ncbi:MAG: hypothetical protein IKD63_00945, partial [Oscillospiraceae bacterium]|nr:hypothetical protein [Oscillospiraceae bacterium]